MLLDFYNNRYMCTTSKGSRDSKIVVVRVNADVNNSKALPFHFYILPYRQKKVGIKKSRQKIGRLKKIRQYKKSVKSD